MRKIISVCGPVSWVLDVWPPDKHVRRFKGGLAVQISVKEQTPLELNLGFYYREKIFLLCYSWTNNCLFPNWTCSCACISAMGFLYCSSWEYQLYQLSTSILFSILLKILESKFSKCGCVWSKHEALGFSSFLTGSPTDIIHNLGLIISVQYPLSPLVCEDHNFSLHPEVEMKTFL